MDIIYIKYMCKIKNPVLSGPSLNEFLVIFVVLRANLKPDFLFSCFCVGTLGLIFPGAYPLSSAESFVPKGVLFGLRARLPLPHAGFVTRRSMSGRDLVRFL